VAAGRAPSFTELVYAHFDWWRRRADGDRSPWERAYRGTLAAFERRHGEIVHAYWCSEVESAVALTERRRVIPWLAPACELHRESDWATKNSPDIARELHRCDEIAVRAKTVLTGVRQRICMQLVHASAAHLLSLVDARASHGDEAKTAEALARERRALSRTEAYYREAANGQAQIVYFAGMALVAVLVATVAAVWLAMDWASPIAALIAGAIGAVVSVIQRIDDGKFALDYDVGRPYALFLGGLRPLVGGALAVAISFAFTGGLLHLPVSGAEGDDRRLALLVLCFVAGFSERWAQDTLTSVVHDERAQRPKPAATPPAEGEHVPGASGSA